jgi:hypothetical protein
MSVEEMVVCLFRREPLVLWWSGGHYSAANLVEACRAYNALLSAADPDAPAAARPRRSRSLFPKSRDSSTNESADRGDVVR